MAPPQRGVFRTAAELQRSVDALCKQYAVVIVPPALDARRVLLHFALRSMAAAACECGVVDSARASKNTLCRTQGKERLQGSEREGVSWLALTSQDRMVATHQSADPHPQAAPRCTCVADRRSSAALQTRAAATSARLKMAHAPAPRRALLLAPARYSLALLAG